MPGTWVAQNKRKPHPGDRKGGQINALQLPGRREGVGGAGRSWISDQTPYAIFFCLHFASFSLVEEAERAN